MTAIDREVVLREIEKLRHVARHPNPLRAIGVRVVDAVADAEGEMDGTSGELSDPTVKVVVGDFLYTMPFVEAMIEAGAEPGYDGGRLVRLCELEVVDGQLPPAHGD